MGLLSDFRDFRAARKAPPVKPAPVERVVGATKEQDVKSVQSFNNQNFTFSGEIADYDYSSILKDKQSHITDLYKIADYYTDADPIVHAIIKHVYVPFSTSCDWIVTGAKKKTVALYEEQYKKMRLREKLDGIMLEYFKYGNVFCYLMEDGNLITLPVMKCKIGSTALNGEPIVDFNISQIKNEWKAKSYSVKENWIKDNQLDYYFKGYPPEVVKALNDNKDYAQLDPTRTFVLQQSKESWQRYAVPLIAACLEPLAKKELISTYEKATLNLGIRSFVHVTYGDSTKGMDILPDKEELSAVRSLFRTGMSGFPLVVTNHLAKATVVKPDLDDLYQWSLYSDVNNDILAAGGVSGIIATGVSNDGSTFASAQISMQTVEARIEEAMNEFADMMNRVNVLLKDNIQGTYNLKETPTFQFTPLSLEGKKALRETCKGLYEKGLVSTKTILESHGYSLEMEQEQKEEEQKNGVPELFRPYADIAAEKAAEAAPASAEPADNSDEETRGRNELEDSERTSDKESALRGKQPKPSNPEGSM